MILGIGTDLCEIARMETKSVHFLERIFSEEERAYAAARGKSGASSLAAMFAAKEAFSKALGTGIRDFGLDEVCVAHDALGAPHYVLKGKALALAEEKGITRLHLSLSHEAGLALAFAVAEGEAKTV